MSDFKLKTRKLENENIRQTLAGCFVFCCLLFIGCFFPLLSFAQCLLTFVTHNSYSFCFLIIELSTLFFLLLWMKMTMRMRWIFCLFCICLWVCVWWKRGEQLRRDKEMEFCLYWWVLLLSICFFFLLIILVIVCGVVCESESSVIVVVLVRWAAHTECESDQTKDASSTKRAIGRRGEEVCLFAVLLFFVRHFVFFFVWLVTLSRVSGKSLISQLFFLFCIFFTFHFYYFLL